MKEKYEHIGPQSEPDSVQHFTASKCPKCVIKINLFSRLKIHRNHYRWSFRMREKVKICIRNGRHSNSFRRARLDNGPRERVWVRSSMFSRKWTNCCSQVSIFNFRTRFNTSGLQRMPLMVYWWNFWTRLNRTRPDRQIAECDDLIPDGMWTHGRTHPQHILVTGRAKWFKWHRAGTCNIMWSTSARNVEYHFRWAGISLWNWLWWPNDGILRGISRSF